MEIVVVGRHTEVADRFREHAEEKLSKIAQYAPTARRVDVEVTHEYNPRQSARSERVELTVRDKGQLSERKLHPTTVSGRLISPSTNSKNAYGERTNASTHPNAGSSQT